MELEELVDLPEDIFASDPPEPEDIFESVPPVDIFESVEGFEVYPQEGFEEVDPSEDIGLIVEGIPPEDIALIVEAIPPEDIDLIEEAVPPEDIEVPEAEVALPSDSVTTTKEQTDGGWQVRVCPILWEDFSRLKKEFISVLKLSTFLEFRMSQHLATRLEPALWTRTVEDRDLPWLPNEKIFTKPKNCATAGMLEFKVLDQNLVEVMALIRSADLTKRNRLRIELKRETLTSEPEEEKTEGEGETKEGEKTEGKEAGGGGDVAPGTNASPADDMIVNFAVRLKPVKEPAFSHKAGYKLQPQDEQIFLKRVPEYVPDYVLKAIVLADLLERQKADDGTSTMAYHVTSPLGAQGYMELFDGVLINNKDIEMSTTLGTLYDAKKQHSEKEKLNREANEKQLPGAKRPFPGDGSEFQMAKRPRMDEGEQDDDGEDLNPIALVWLRGQQSLTRGGLPKLMSGRLAMQHRILALRDQGVYVSQGAIQRGRGRAWIRGGYAGRGAQRGRGVPYRGRGGGQPPGRGGGGASRHGERRTPPERRGDGAQGGSAASRERGSAASREWRTAASGKRVGSPGERKRRDEGPRV